MDELALPQPPLKQRIRTLLRCCSDSVSLTLVLTVLDSDSPGWAAIEYLRRGGTIAGARELLTNDQKIKQYNSLTDMGRDLATTSILARAWCNKLRKASVVPIAGSQNMVQISRLRQVINDALTHGWLKSNPAQLDQVPQRLDYLVSILNN